MTVLEVEQRISTKVREVGEHWEWQGAKCGNRLCVRIDHLEAVTHAENMKRRSNFGQITDFIKEPHAHTTDLLPNGHCRLCRNAYHKAWRDEKRLGGAIT